MVLLSCPLVYVEFVSSSNFCIQDNIQVSALPVSLVVTGCSMAADTVLSPPIVAGDVIVVTLSAELVAYNDTAEQKKYYLHSSITITLS